MMGQFVLTSKTLLGHDRTVMAHMTRGRPTMYRFKYHGQIRTDPEQSDPTPDLVRPMLPNSPCCVILHSVTYNYATFKYRFNQL